jgi:hypothetical protein
MIELSVAIVVRENVAEGSLVTVQAVETLQPEPRLKRGQEDLPATFQQAEVKLALAVDEVRQKALDQLRAHRRLLEAGEHPMGSA